MSSDCAICLAAVSSTTTHRFSCGCSTVAHLECLMTWLKKPENGCIYCRKPAQLLREKTVIRSPQPTIIVVVAQVPPAAAEVIQLSPTRYIALFVAILITCVSIGLVAYACVKA